MKLTVESTGAFKLQRTLRTIEREIEKSVEKKVLRAGAIELRTEAKGTSAFKDDTGNLRRSIRVQEADDDVLVVAGDASAPYAADVEFGHGKVKPHPFMRPAVEGARERIQKAEAQAASRGIARTVKRVRGGAT